MENLYFRMQGAAFDDGYRLDKTINGLSGLQTILEGVYKGASGKSRLSKKDREQFNLVAYEVRNGSLLVYLGAIFTGVQEVLPFLPSLSPDALWQYTKTTAAFLHEIYGAAHAGESISIEQNEDNVAVIHKGDKNITNIYQGPVIQVGHQMIKGLRQLDDTLEEKTVNNIQVGNRFEKEPAIILPFEEKGLYYPPITVDEKPKVLLCDIYEFDKYEKQGRLSVSANQELPEGSYKFRVISRQEPDDFILSMTESSVNVNCNGVRPRHRYASNIGRSCLS